MKRLGVLYPPTGAEYEYYHYGETFNADADGVRVSLVGVRIYGDEQEHAERFLRRTAEIENLLLSAANLKPLKPDAAIWACTSGSFIRGSDYAQQQVKALEALLQCPVSSTSLAFISALKHLSINKVAILCSYPDQTSVAFSDFLIQQQIDVTNALSLGLDSGPVASTLDQKQLVAAIENLRITADSALLIPDTAIPTLSIVDALEQRLNRVVLTANQVSLWEVARLSGSLSHRSDMGSLFRFSG